MTDTNTVSPRPERGERLADTDGVWKLIDLNGRVIYVDLDERVSYAPEPNTPGASADTWEPFRYRPEIQVGNPVFFVRPDRWERTTLIRSFESVPVEAAPSVIDLPAERNR
jgi:hypothetical protein